VDIVSYNNWRVNYKNEAIKLLHPFHRDSIFLKGYTNIPHPKTIITKTANAKEKARNIKQLSVLSFMNPPSANFHIA
jgi:hypothetical protein